MSDTRHDAIIVNGIRIATVEVPSKFAKYMVRETEPLRTPRELIQAITEYRDRWIGKKWSPTTVEMMTAEADDIRSRARPEAYLGLEKEQLDFGIAFKPDPEGPAGSLICTLK